MNRNLSNSSWHPTPYYCLTSVAYPTKEVVGTATLLGISLIMHASFLLQTINKLATAVSQSRWQLATHKQSRFHDPELSIQHTQTSLLEVCVYGGSHVAIESVVICMCVMFYWYY